MNSESGDTAAAYAATADGRELWEACSAPFPDFTPKTLFVSENGGATWTERKVPAGLGRAEDLLARLKRIDPGYAPDELKQAIKDYIAALKGAFTALAARHDSLRTRFDVREGQPVQVVEPSMEIPVTVVHAASPRRSSGTAAKRRRHARPSRR